MNLRIFPPDNIIEASVDLPLSKSMSARALIINKIGNFNNDIKTSECEDTLALKDGLSISEGSVNVGASGTAMRFLTALYAATENTDVIIDGNERMRQRPIKILVEALRELGANIEYCDKEGFAPLHIRGQKLNGGLLTVDTTVSSQFVSALMMIAPLMKSPLSICFESEPTSLSYIKLTGAMMTEAGVEPEIMHCRIDVPNNDFVHPITAIERDWSAASYWYSISALSAGWVTLNDMHSSSPQGDSIMIKLGERLGVITSESEDIDGALELSASPEQFSRLDIDLSSTPDLTQTLAIASAALGIPFKFQGIHTLRHKETNRIEALRSEALKLGLIFETDGDDIIQWDGRRVPIQEVPRIKTHGDHRMAMSFAPVALYLPGIIIEDVEVVSKSYPEFRTHLEEAGFTLSEEN